MTFKEWLEVRPGPFSAFGAQTQPQVPLSASRLAVLLYEPAQRVDGRTDGLSLTPAAHFQPPPLRHRRRLRTGVAGGLHADCFPGVDCSWEAISDGVGEGGSSGTAKGRCSIVRPGKGASKIIDAVIGAGVTPISEKAHRRRGADDHKMRRTQNARCKTRR